MNEQIKLIHLCRRCDYDSCVYAAGRYKAIGPACDMTDAEAYKLCKNFIRIKTEVRDSGKRK